MVRKESQDIKILRAVNRRKNQKTFEIARIGLDMFITHGDRCLRRLAELKLVVGERVEGKSYKQWNITQKGKEYLHSLNS